MKFYLSDLHLAHARIIQSCARPFSDVRAMDAALIRAWHDRMGRQDEVFVVGDLIFGGRKTDPLPYLEALKGPSIHLILGNHDFWIKRVPKPERFFASVSPALRVADGGRDLLLCHDPAQGLPLLEPHETLIYGHLHGNTDRPYEGELRRLGALNCGADITGFRPATLEELIAYNRSFRAAHPAASEQEV